MRTEPTRLEILAYDVYLEISGGDGGSRLKRHTWQQVYRWSYRRWGWPDLVR